MKKFTIRKHNRFGGTRDVSGTMDELREYFEMARPRTATALVSALNKNVADRQGCCYNRDRYELVG